jgi:hypothetical protein
MSACVGHATLGIPAIRQVERGQRGNRLAARRGFPYGANVMSSSVGRGAEKVAA